MALPQVLIVEGALVAVVVSNYHELKLGIFGLTKFSSDRSRRLPAVVRPTRASSG